MGRDKAVAPGEEADIDIASCNILEAFVNRTLVRGNIVLHASHVVAQLSQHAVDRISVLDQIAVCGRDINRCHGHLHSKPVASALHAQGEFLGYQTLDASGLSPTRIA
jgi:hypothetical protein